jgi:hypothetical protein
VEMTTSYDYIRLEHNCLVVEPYPINSMVDLLSIVMLVYWRVSHEYAIWLVVEPYPSEK